MVRSIALLFFVLIFLKIGSQAQTGEYNYGFETPLTKPPWGVEGLVNMASVVVDPTDHENKVLRAMLPIPAEGSVWNNATTRSEIRWQKGANGIPNWFPNGSSYSFQFRIYIPEYHICDPISPEIVAQWHQPNGFKLRSPPVSVRIQDCNILISIQTSAVFDGDQNTLKKSLLRSGYQWEKGSWHYFIIDITFDYATDGHGAINAYMNTSGWPKAGDSIVTYKGPVGYNNGIGQNFKLGVYKWPWKSAGTVKQARISNPPVSERVYYYDDVSIKNGLEFE
jgi:hypothetical protein